MRPRYFSRVAQLCIHCVQVFKDLRESGHYEDSAGELDAALVELTSSPEFPKVLLQNCMVYVLIQGVLLVVMLFSMCRVLLVCGRKPFPRQGYWLYDIF